MWQGGITTHGKYGDPHEQARRANGLVRQTLPDSPPVENSGWNQPSPWGWHGSEWQGRNSPHDREKMQARFDQFLPRMSSGGQPAAAADFFEGFMPEGASLAPGAGTGYKGSLKKSAALRKGAGGNLPFGGSLGGGGGGVSQTPARPYQPEFESPDRQNYPVHRSLANVYWRLFYKLDALIGNAVDMYAELPWGDFELTGDGVDGEVKDAMERMCEASQLRTMLPYFVREYLVIGEACPHLFYDDDEGIWTYIGMHNPDQLEVIHTPFIKMDPVVRFKPDARLQQVLMSDHEMVRSVRDSMPPELLAALMGGQHVELSPVNFTFLARKMHPYDVRGTSIISRMWRPLMYEDAIFNASIATARRHAGPIKVAKLGDAQTGWIPGPEHEQKLIELLAQAELDPHAWLVYHYGINFDLVGTTERVMTIDKHWDLIERIKLIALGISKAFLHGEVTYASAASGLTVFLQRLKAMRQYFESAWIYPKFFRPVSEMNAWIKPTEAELSHKVRTRRSQRDLIADDRYIMPTIEWARQLDPSVESAQLQAVTSLSQLGITFSKQYLASLVGKDWEEELRQRAREAKIEQEIMAENPDLQMAMPQPGAEGGPGGGMAPGPMPGIPPEAMGFPGEDPGGMGGEMPGGDMGGGEMPAGPMADAGSEGGPTGRYTRLKSKLWKNGMHGDWSEADVADLIEILEGYPPTEDIWVRMIEGPDGSELRAALSADDEREALDLIESLLLDEGHPPKSISDLKAILTDEKRAPEVTKTSSRTQLLYDSMSDSGAASTLVGAP